METCWTILYVNGDNKTYFDSFVIENIKENQNNHGQQKYQNKC